MTSFMISAFEDRSIPQTWFDEDCVFCKIVAKKTNAFVVWENEDVIAFLDTLPIRPGHTLVVPKSHVARVTDLPLELARAVGEAVARVGDAVTKGMENPNINIVCNQGYAQAVHHVHFHLVPSPIFNGPSSFNPSFSSASAPTPAVPESQPQANDPTQTINPATQHLEQTLEVTGGTRSVDTSNSPTTAKQTSSTAQNPESIFTRERSRRSELDGDDALIIAEKIRCRL